MPVIAARYLAASEHIVPGSDGLMPDPHTAHGNHQYTFGVGDHPGEISVDTQATAGSQEGSRDIHPADNSKQTQRWTVAVGKASLLWGAVSPMAKLSVVATCTGQHDLIVLADLCAHLSPQSLPLATTANSTLNPIAQISKEISDIQIEAHVLQLRQLFKCMQLSVLVERLVSLNHYVFGYCLTLDPLGSLGFGRIVI